MCQKNVLQAPEGFDVSSSGKQLSILKSSGDETFVQFCY